MGVSSISNQDLRTVAVPASARTPYVSEKMPQEADSKVKYAESAQILQTADAEPLANTTNIRLRFDKETNRIIAQIVDENNEVVRQVPPEEVLRIAAKTRRMLGLLFDETV